MPQISLRPSFSNLRRRLQKRLGRIPAKWRAVAAVAVVGAVLVAGQAGFGRSSAPQTVKVRWGDTLWGLSREYHVSMAQLAAANHMKTTDVLYAGRTLVLPGAGAKATATATTVASGAATNGAMPANPSAVEGTFCSIYQAPTQPRGKMPSQLLANPARLSLRPLFVEWSKLYGVPTDLMEAEAWQESGWQNNVVSPAPATPRLP